MLAKPRKKNQRIKKYNRFVPREVKYLDYKDTELLSHFINNQGKIIPAAASGLTSRQQRALARAVKRARQMALLPYVKERIRR